MPTRGELIANNKTVEEIKNYLDVDQIIYQDIQSLSEAVMRKGDHHIDQPCMACFDKNYITKEMSDERINEWHLCTVEVFMHSLHQNTPPACGYQ